MENLTLAKVSLHLISSRDVDKDFLTAAEVAERFQVTVSSVSRWARVGKLRGYRTPGGGLRFRTEDVEAALAVEVAEIATEGVA